MASVKLVTTLILRVGSLVVPLSLPMTAFWGLFRFCCLLAHASRVYDMFTIYMEESSYDRVFYLFFINGRYERLDTPRIMKAQNGLSRALGWEIRRRRKEQSEWYFIPQHGHGSDMYY